MSRSAKRNITVFMTLPCAVGAGAAFAQDPPKLTAEQALQNADVAYRSPPKVPVCQPQSGDEIIVCAQKQEQSQFRVKSSTQLDATSEEALDDGLPRAPDFAPPPCEPNLLTVCPKLGEAPTPAIFVDVTALPEAPEGSDAAKIARGEQPSH